MGSYRMHNFHDSAPPAISNGTKLGTGGLAVAIITFAAIEFHCLSGSSAHGYSQLHGNPCVGAGVGRIGGRMQCDCTPDGAVIPPPRRGSALEHSNHALAAVDEHPLAVTAQVQLLHLCPVEARSLRWREDLPIHGIKHLSRGLQHRAVTTCLADRLHEP